MGPALRVPTFDLRIEANFKKIWHKLLLQFCKIFNNTFCIIFFFFELEQYFLYCSMKNFLCPTSLNWYDEQIRLTGNNSSTTTTSFRASRPFIMSVYEGWLLDLFKDPALPLNKFEVYSFDTKSNWFFFRIRGKEHILNKRNITMTTSFALRFMINECIYIPFLHGETWSKQNVD